LSPAVAGPGMRGLGVVGKRGSVAHREIPARSSARWCKPRFRSDS